MPSRRPHRDLRVRGDPTYRARLDRGWEEIVEWASRTRQVALEGLRRRPRALDDLCAEFVQFMYNSRRSRGDTTHSLLAVQRELRAKGKLVEAWEAMDNWRLSEPAVTRTPLPERTLLAHVAVAVALATQTAGQRNGRVPLRASSSTISGYGRAIRSNWSRGS